MRRREFITLLGGAAAAWPLATRAQQLAVPIVGFLHSASAASFFLHELLPKAARFGLLVNPGNPQRQFVIAGSQMAASAIGLSLEILTAKTNPEITAAFTSAVQKRVEALFVMGDPLFTNRIVQLATLAARHAIPTMYVIREFAEAGGLMSYGSNFTELYRQAGIYVGRILKGEKPADLPVLQASKFELIVNTQ